MEEQTVQFHFFDSHGSLDHKSVDDDGVRWATRSQAADEVINNRYILEDIDLREAGVSRPRPLHRRLRSDPIFTASLPPFSRLCYEATEEAKKSRHRAIIAESLQSAQSTSLPSPPSDSGSPDAGKDRELSQDGSEEGGGGGGGGTVRKRKRKYTFGNSSGMRKIQHHDVLSAIDRKDIMELMEIRDRAFPLLVTKHIGGSSPLVYAMRQGQSHREVTILLIGALSRFVNSLTEEDFRDFSSPPKVHDGTPASKMSKRDILRAVRTNLKAAIDYGISQNSTDLISSYLQVILMSEGERWVNDQRQRIGLALRAGKSGKPVQTARSVVKAFATKELANVRIPVASVEDFQANAATDLVIMACWSLISDKVGGDQIPVYQFARDDRVFRTFCDNVDHASTKPDWAKVPKPFKTQAAVLRKGLENRTMGHRQKLEVLQAELDD